MVVCGVLGLLSAACTPVPPADSADTMHRQTVRETERLDDATPEALDAAAIERHLAQLFAAHPAAAGTPPPLADEAELAEIAGPWRVELWRAAEPDFAGRHRLGVMGCGTACQLHLLVDPVDGGPPPGVTSTHGSRYRLDSLLIVLNDPAALLELARDTEAPLPAYYRPRCFVLEDDRFRPLTAGCDFGLPFEE